MKFSNVEDPNFGKDFHLPKVFFAEPPSGSVGCVKEHKDEARQKEMLKWHKRDRWTALVDCRKVGHTERQFQSDTQPITE